MKANVKISAEWELMYSHMGKLIPREQQAVMYMNSGDESITRPRRTSSLQQRELDSRNRKETRVMFALLKLRELVHQKMLSTTTEEVAADKVHHSSLSLGSWDAFHQFKLSGTSAAEMRF